MSVRGAADAVGAGSVRGIGLATSGRASGRATATTSLRGAGAGSVRVTGTGVLCGAATTARGSLRITGTGSLLGSGRATSGRV